VVLERVSLPNAFLALWSIIYSFTFGSNEFQIWAKPSNIILTAHSAWGSTLVHVYVGPEERKFSVHKKLMCSASAFFDKAFNSGFQQTNTGKIALPEDSPYVFQAFMKWLYHGKLEDLSPDNEKWILKELLELYLFDQNPSVLVFNLYICYIRDNIKLFIYYRYLNLVF